MTTLTIANRRPGFTIIEMMVVVTLVAVLITILLPAIKSARETAQGAICTANLKQVGGAAANYTVDYRQYEPVWYWTVPAQNYKWFAPVDTNSPQLFNLGPWYIEIRDYLNYDRDTTDPTFGVNVKKRFVIHCPAESVATDWRYPHFSFSNYTRDFSQTPTNGTYPVGLRDERLYKPAEHAFLVDSTSNKQWWNLDNRFISFSEDFFQYRHPNLGASHLFFDGHAEIRVYSMINRFGRYPFDTTNFVNIPYPF